MSGAQFAGIDELVADIKRNYKGSEIGNNYNDKYRITTVDSGTLSAIFEKLNGFLTKRDVKIIFLVAEETNG